MNIYKYRVFNYTTKKFEFLTTSKKMNIGEFKTLPQGELQIFSIVNIF